VPAIFSNSVCSNGEVFADTNRLALLLNSVPGYLRLFKNSFVPSPASLNGDFIEANFSGYAPQSLHNLFPAPVKQEDGFYATSTPSLVFSNSGVFDATVYGCWVSLPGGWCFASLFPTPALIGAGQTFPLTVTWQGIDLSVALA